MARRCSHCGRNGHNSRTCIGPKASVGDGGGVRLFGVQLHAAPDVRKSFSTECLTYNHPADSSSSSSNLISIHETTGNLSDGLVARTQERKKGVPWTEEEHRLFLAGLEKLGKGDWRGISRNFATTRTPVQVASHAQKYFLRQNSLYKNKCSSSLLDMDCFSTELDSPVLSLNSIGHGMDFNSSEEAHEPSCLGLTPD